MSEDGQEHHIIHTDLTTERDMRKKTIKKYLLITGCLTIIIFALLFIYAAMNLSVEPELEAQQYGPYPFSSTYSVQIPEGSTYSIGGLKLVLLNMDGELIMKVGDKKERMTPGETKIISERRMRITTLGLPVLDLNYQLSSEYRGTNGNISSFHVTLKSSRQIPSPLIRWIVPSPIRIDPS